VPYFFNSFLYDSVTITEIGQHLTELQSNTDCHCSWRTQCIHVVR